MYAAFQRWLTNVPLRDPIERRLAPLLQIFLLAFAGIAALVIPLVPFYIDLSQSDITTLLRNTLLPIIVLILALLGLVAVVRRGYFKIALWLAVLLSLFWVTQSLTRANLNSNGLSLLTLIIPITLAGLLINRWALLLTIGLTFFVVLVVSYNQQPAGTHFIITPIALIYALVMGFFGVLLSAFGSTLRGELAASTAHGEELERSNKTLADYSAELSKLSERLAVTLRSIGDAVITTNAEGHIMLMNDVAQRVSGWTQSEAAGQHLSAVFRIVNEETRQTVESPVDKVLREGTVVGLANHTILITKQGREVPIDDSGAPIRDAEDAIVGVVLVFRDITERRQAENRAALLQEFTTDLAKVLTLDELNEAITEKAISSLGGHIAIVALLGEDKQFVEIQSAKGLESEAREQYQRISLDQSLPLTDAVRTGQMIYIQSLEEYTARYPHVEALLRDGTKSQATVCIPLTIRGNTVGGVSVSFSKSHPIDDEDETFFKALGEEFSQALERTQLYQREQDARAAAERNALRLTRLQALTASLSGAVSLEEVLNHAIEHLVPAIDASTIGITLLNDDEDALETKKSYGVAPEVVAQFGSIPMTRRIPITDALRSRQPVWHPSVEAFRQSYPEFAAQLTIDRSQAFANIPLISEGQVIGGMSFGFNNPQTFDDNDKNFILALAQQCAQAIERARLAEQAVISAAHEERQRLARELHDAVSQALFSATTIAETVPRLWERNPQRARENLEQVVLLNRGAMAEMRTLLLELRPEAIIRTNLSELLKQLVEAVKGRKRAESNLVLEGEDDLLPPEVQIAIYRITQEALTNIIKHSEASQFTVQLSREAAKVTLTIRDNGRGFDLTQTTAGFGLSTMRERAEALGAAIQVTSTPGTGTQITLTWENSEIAENRN